MYDLNTRLLQTIVYVLNASHLSQVVIITTDRSFKKIEKKVGFISLSLSEKATSQLLLEQDWDSTMQICDIIRQGDVQ